MTTLPPRQGNSTPLPPGFPIPNITKGWPPSGQESALLHRIVDEAETDVESLEGLVNWLLDQASVCIADEFASPVTIAFGSDWLVVPDEFHHIVRAYKEARDAE